MADRNAPYRIEYVKRNPLGQIDYEYADTLEEASKLLSGKDADVYCKYRVFRRVTPDDVWFETRREPSWCSTSTPGSCGFYQTIKSHWVEIDWGPYFNSAAKSVTITE